MPSPDEEASNDVRRRRSAAVLLVAAAVLQLLGQVLLRLPSAEASASGTWTIAHVVLVLAAASLLAGMAVVALVTGPGVGTWLGLAVLAAGAVVVGSVALAHSLVTDRGHGSYAWISVATVVVYAVAGTVSWRRAALALVVLAWTFHHLRTTNVGAARAA